MGKQYNRREKRKRRTTWIKRRRETAKVVKKTK